MQSRHFIQLFRERLSEVHATIPKGIVGGFEGNVLPSKKFERMVREATDICLRVLKESNKSRFDSFSRYEQCIDHIPLITFRDCRVRKFFRQPFSKQLYTVRTLRLTIISTFGTLSRGLGDKGIWRIVRTPEKILVTPLFM